MDIEVLHGINHHFDALIQAYTNEFSMVYGGPSLGGPKFYIGCNEGKKIKNSFLNNQKWKYNCMWHDLFFC